MKRSLPDVSAWSALAHRREGRARDVVDFLLILSKLDIVKTETIYNDSFNLAVKLHRLAKRLRKVRHRNEHAQSRSC